MSQIIHVRTMYHVHTDVQLQCLVRDRTQEIHMACQTYWIQKAVHAQSRPSTARDEAGKAGHVQTRQIYTRYVRTRYVTSDIIPAVSRVSYHTSINSTAEHYQEYEYKINYRFSL